MHKEGCCQCWLICFVIAQSHVNGSNAFALFCYFVASCSNLGGDSAPLAEEGGTVTQENSHCLLPILHVRSQRCTSKLTRCQLLVSSVFTQLKSKTGLPLLEVMCYERKWWEAKSKMAYSLHHKATSAACHLLQNKAPWNLYMPDSLFGHTGVVNEGRKQNTHKIHKTCGCITAVKTCRSSLQNWAMWHTEWMQDTDINACACIKQGRWVEMLGGESVMKQNNPQAVKATPHTRHNRRDKAGGMVYSHAIKGLTLGRIRGVHLARQFQCTTWCHHKFIKSLTRLE